VLAHMFDKRESKEMLPRESRPHSDITVLCMSTFSICTLYINKK